MTYRRSKTAVSSEAVGDDLLLMKFTRPRGVAEARVLVGTPEAMVGPQGLEEQETAYEAIRDEEWAPGSAVAYLQWIGVTKPRARGRGIGTLLLDDVIGELLDKVDAIYLVPAGDDAKQSERLADWYARHGFYEAGWGSANPVMVRWQRRQEPVTP